MKKAVLIYDTQSGKLIDVCDVRDLPSDKFDTLSHEAKKNIRALLQERKDKQQIKDDNLERVIKSLENRIVGLQKIVQYLLGFVNFEDEETLKKLCNFVESEAPGDE